MDVVLVHYHAPRGGYVYERILRHILSLPNRPLLAYIAHCTMSDCVYIFGCKLCWLHCWHAE